MGCGVNKGDYSLGMIASWKNSRDLAHSQVNLLVCIPPSLSHRGILLLTMCCFRAEPYIEPGSVQSLHYRQTWQEG